MARVLVIDDEPMIRDLIELRLARLGHEVVTAADGIEAIELHSAAPAELVITDLFMPQKDGLETIKELRRSSPDVKVIAVSGGGQVAHMSYLDVASEFGACAVLSKPIDFAKLQQVIDDCLGSTSSCGDQSP